MQKLDVRRPKQERQPKGRCPRLMPEPPALAEQAGREPSLWLLIKAHQRQANRHIYSRIDAYTRLPG
jgi:hypothetical protein